MNGLYRFRITEIEPFAMPTPVIERLMHVCFRRAKTRLHVTKDDPYRATRGQDAQPPLHIASAANLDDRPLRFPDQIQRITQARLHGSSWQTAGHQKSRDNVTVVLA